MASNGGLGDLPIRIDGKALILGDSPGGNYLEKVKALAAAQKPGSLFSVTIQHDDWCALIVYGKACDCDPDVRIEDVD